MKHKQPPCSSITPRIPPSNRLKLVCSSHGRFHRRPFDGKLRYTGGESRIISVDPTTLTYSYLCATIAKLCKPESSGFTLKYMLPGGGYDGDGLLVLLANDDDVKCMVEEFEIMESYGKISRLWLYVFDGRDDDHGFYDDESDSKDHGSLKSDDLGYGFGDLRLDMGFRDEKMMGYVKGGFGRNGLGEGLGRRDGMDGRRVSDNCLRRMVLNGKNDDLRLNSGFRGEKMVGSVKGDYGRSGRVSDNCLRKMVLKQQLLLARKKIQGNKCGDPVVNLGIEQNGSDGCEVLCDEDRDGKDDGNLKDEGLGSGDLRLDFGSTGEKMVGCVKGNSGSNGLGKGFVRRDGVNGRSVSDNCLRKMVLKQQLLARKQVQVKKCGDPVVNLGAKVGGDVDSNGLGHVQPLNPVDHNLVEVKNPSLESSMVNSSQGVVVDSVMKQGLGFTERVLSKYFNRENILPSSQEWDALNSQLSCGNRVAGKPEMHKSFHRGLRVSGRHCNIDNTRFGSNDIRTSRVVHPSHDGIDFSVEPSGDKDKHSKATTKGQSRSLDANFSVVNMDSQNAERVASGVTSSNPKNPYGKLMHVKGISELTDIAACNGNALLSVNDVMAQSGESAQEEMQDLSHTTLNISDNGDESRCHKTLSVPNGMPGNLASFYSHLATQELQLIKGSDLEYIKELGSGNYGTVYYGKWKGCDVAIKKIRATCFRDVSKDDDRLVADFWKEADKLGQLHHPNIIAFYGVVSEGPITKLATVTEYMINGSLKQVLQRKDRTIDRRKRLIIAMDAALGMQYLHEKNIVHFDLKSHNLLVNMRDPERPVCKVGDLGLSKIKQRTLVSGGVRGTIPWMAPELLSTTANLVTEKVDVYSFGIVMWELLTGEEPYANMRSSEILGGIMKGTLRPKIPCWCEPAWRSLMERCWSSDPKSRPSFSEVAKELRAMSADMNLK